MNIRIQIIVGIIVILALVVIVNMIRTKKIGTKVCIVLVVCGHCSISVRLFSAVDHLAVQKGRNSKSGEYALFFGFCFSLIILFVLTIAMSRMSIRIKELTQEIALFEKKMDEQ